LEAVIKVGGSLSETPQTLEALSSELSRLAKKHRFVVVPGGGKFADAVRDVDARSQLPAAVSHRMAILAMDQYGLLLSTLIPSSVSCDSVKAAREVTRAGRVEILLPSKMMHKSDPFEPSWDVTSDSIAAYIASKLKASVAIFVTDVDGIFTSDPKKHSNAKMLSQVSVEELMRFSGRTSVDKFLPEFLSQHTLNCYVVNGRFPERLAAILSGQETVATRILSRTELD
jgi:5-(aminomethyl)-3-furanmethanol phosphate kinase